MEAQAERQQTAQASPALMPLPAVEAKTGLKKTSIYALMKKDGPDRFPAPIRVLKRNVLWVSTDVDRWIAECIRASMIREKRSAAC